MARHFRKERGGTLLRISPAGSSTHVVHLKIEGALVGKWVSVLERACAGPLQTGKQVELDFGDVGFLDGRAVAAVRALAAKGVVIVRPSPLVQDLLWPHHAS
jgi:hypothetical protein